MGIARAAFIIMVGNVLSRLLGVVREQVIASLFGASAATDAFAAASRVPTTLYDLLIGGMIAAALVPVFSDYTKPKEEAELWRIASAVLNLGFLVLSLVVLLLILLAPRLMWVFAYGFDVETTDLAIHLVRWMLPSVIFMGLAGILIALLYSRQNFTLPALAGAAYNGGIVVGALLLHTPWGITSLVAGALVGAFLQVALQLPGLRRMNYSLWLNPFHPGLRRILMLYLPVALGLVVSAVGVAIDSNLVSRTGEGNMAAMRFATTLIQFPLGIVAAALSYALLPTLSRYATMTLAPNNMGKNLGQGYVMKAVDLESPLGDQPSLVGGPALAAYKNTLALGIKMMLLAILPATVGLVVLRVPIIQLLFQHGVFDAHATQRTALAFLAYAPGLPAAAVDQILIFSFYARKNTLTPVIVGVMGVLVYLVVGVSLLSPLGMPGLALANSAQWIAHAVVMFFLLYRMVGGLGGLGLEAVATKALGASLAMATALYLARPILSSLLDTGGIVHLSAYVGLAIGWGILVYVCAILILKVAEADTLWQVVRRRLGRANNR
ncbi:MAG: murein biosynthesis integral membrane protein MurJ [Chloroflexi bacterium]|nr:murein biosynthesis integral membrane protein MurJ [Chloroflexota bacterium]